MSVLDEVSFSSASIMLWYCTRDSAMADNDTEMIRVCDALTPCSHNAERIIEDGVEP